MDALEFVLASVYLPFFYLAAMLYLNFNPQQVKYRKYLFWGMTVKLVGGLAFAMVYTYFYTYGGDTKTYFYDGSRLSTLLFQDPLGFMGYVFGDLSKAEVSRPELISHLFHNKWTGEFFVTRFTSFFTILGFQRFLPTTLLYSVFSFIGVWHIFMTFVKRYPRLHKRLAISVLFIPSVFFWGSGIMKDSITIGFIGILLYYLDLVKRREGRLLVNIFLVSIASYVIFKVKAYVLISFFPALLLFFFLSYRDKISNAFLRTISLPLFLGVGLSMMTFSIIKLGEINEDYSIENFFRKAKGMQTWHYIEGENQGGTSGRGSSYSLGDYEENFTGLVSAFPAAVNVTLFRPYVTEVNSPLMLLSALESLAIFLASIFILLKVGPIRLLRYLNQDSFLIMCVVFSIFFAFAVGFTSYNFGALVRYKIPCIPFYVAGLFILYYKAQSEKEEKRQRLLYAKRRNRLAGVSE